jgi:hypothetical protein
VPCLFIIEVWDFFMSGFQGQISPEAKSMADDVAGTDAVGKVSDLASDLYETTLEASKKSADAISAHVQRQPLTSLLIAFAAGFVFSKILTR